MMTFDRKFARLLLEICRYSYATGIDNQNNANDKEDALDWINEAGGLRTDIAEPIKILKGSATSVACIASYPDKNIVSYMGTTTDFSSRDAAVKSIDDWLQNIRLLLTPFELTNEQLGIAGSSAKKVNLGGKVHKGFLDELSAVQAHVIQELENRGGKNKPLYVTGHSQGGAEAALATKAFLHGEYPLAATYTFAAARAGDAEFKKSIPETLPVHRIEFGDDIVPHVPPALIGKSLKSIAGALKLFPLSDEAKSLIDRLISINEQIVFDGLGGLCYGSYKTKSFRVDISPEDEAELFKDRLLSLAINEKNWAEHHHLAGTSEEQARSVKGNYTALVSSFPLAN